MKNRKSKYYFTQLSAPVVFFISIFFLLKFTKTLYPEFFIDSDRNKIFIFSVVFVPLSVFSMVLWGKVLVLMKILSREEAQGYPYSKPWKNENDIL